MNLPADPRIQQLAELTDCAYRMAVAFAAEQERVEGWEKKLELFRLFDRCFFSVRVAIALELRLTRGPAAGDGAAASEREAAERDPPDPLERGEAPERYDERDRERDVERASLPILLRTLEGVVADAEALPGPKPAALPTLRELLTHVKTAPAAAPNAAQGLRARLAGSTAATTLTKPASSGARAIGPIRRAIGPPHPT